MIKEINATGKEIEQMLLSGEILRAKLDIWYGDCGYVVNDNEIKFLQSNGIYQTSELINGYSKDVFNWEVVYPTPTAQKCFPEAIEIREPFKSFLDACEWLSDIDNEYAYSKNNSKTSNYGASLKELKSRWQTMFKVYNAEVKTKTVRYYVDSHGNEVEVKDEN